MTEVKHDLLKQQESPTITTVTDCEEIVRLQNKTLKHAVEYLESIGLSVYGQNCDVETGEQFPSLRVFGPEDVVKYRKLYEKYELWMDE